MSNKDPSLKGKFGGNCNRTACQTPIRSDNWFNTSTRAYYCTPCARAINQSSLHFDGVEICKRVTDPSDQPRFPWNEIQAFAASRTALASTKDPSHE
ncbi:hypothetical protein [Methylobacterium terrae]|uniref:hypothetical protein n=1 Tax=Methylobacterium terrae TaxID=2202827 RepID=UPI0013A563F6|nr:hypothetical protein [Methylobacterium terrae]